MLCEFDLHLRNGEKEEQVKLAMYRRGWNNGKKTDKTRPTVTEFGLSYGILWCYLFITMICYCRYFFIVFDGQPLCIISQDI